MPMGLDELVETADKSLHHSLTDSIINQINQQGKNFVRTDWNDFPNVVLVNSKTTISEHRDYTEAKAGNLNKAISLVNDYLDEDSLVAIQQMIEPHQNVVLLPIHAEESLGRNKLPIAFASWLESYLDIPIESSIVQAAKVNRTGADGLNRLITSVPFSGQVKVGQKYLLIDDAVTQGGTLADLKGFIESQNGIVIGATVLMGKPHSAKLAITKATLGQLRKQAGKELEQWWYEQFGYDFSKFTESEARYLAKQIHRSGIDAVRDKLTQARLERISHKSS